MNPWSFVDTALDRTIVLGYGNVGLEVRKRLPGWPADPPRMDGRRVLVTGAGSGLGQATARGFARLGATVHVLARNAERAEKAAQQVRAAVAGAVVFPEAVDLSSRHEIRAFAERFSSEHPRLDVLVNNAGVMPGERTHSGDGVELAFATHVLAPWMLIEGLTESLANAAPSRVIDVSSGGQYGQAVPAGDWQSERTTYGPTKNYARTKREQVTISQMWAEKLAPRGVHVHAMHPGWADTNGVRTQMPVFRVVTRPILRSDTQGADTIVWLGSAPEGAATTGLFWHDRRARPATHPLGPGPDPETARTGLWDHVESLAHTVDPVRMAT